MLPLDSCEEQIGGHRGFMGFPQRVVNRWEGAPTFIINPLFATNPDIVYLRAARTRANDWGRIFAGTPGFGNDTEGPDVSCVALQPEVKRVLCRAVLLEALSVPVPNRLAAARVRLERFPLARIVEHSESQPQQESRGI